MTANPTDRANHLAMELVAMLRDPKVQRAFSGLFYLTASTLVTGEPVKPHPPRHRGPAGGGGMSTPIATITAMVIHPPDEAGGAFFELHQDDRGPIRADLEDLQALVIAAQRMLGQEVAA